MKTLLILFLSAGIMAAHKCSQSSAAPADNSPLVRLETHGCRGFCPTYSLMFLQNGKVLYEGKRNMVKMGADSVQLTPGEISELRDAVRKLNLWQYPERTESRVADAPQSTITVFDGNRQHAVTGDFQRPRPVVAFEEMLKDLVEKHGLKVKEGVNPYQAPPNQKEIVVQFKPEINPGNFFMQMTDIQIRIVKRLSSANQWLIGYNPDQITEKQLIEKLKIMDGVVEAAPSGE